MDKNTDGKNTILTLSAITLVNALNYGLNLLLGRWLGPEGFADANLLATIVLVLSFLGVAIQLSVAKMVAGDTEGQEKSWLRWIEKNSMHAGIVLGMLGFLSSSFIADLLHLKNSWSLAIIMLGIPLYFSISARRGYFQGIQNFKWFSMTYVLETVGRSTITVGLLLYTTQWHQEWNALAVGVGFFGSFASTYWYGITRVKLEDKMAIPAEQLRTLMFFILAICAYELSQICINNVDVILVKHFFDDFNAGIYSSVSLIGRIVYFGTWTIVTLLFPKVIEKEKKGESHTHLFYQSLAIVFAAGAIITVSCFWQGELIMTILFGKKYLSAAPLLWKYAASTTIFASANVFAYYHMSLNRYLPIGITLLAGLAQISAIFWFHDSLQQVIRVQIYFMSSLLLIMLVYHFLISSSKVHQLKLVFSH